MCHNVRASGTTRHNALNTLIQLLDNKDSTKSKDRVKFKLLAYMFQRRNESFILLRDSFGVYEGQYLEMRSEADNTGYVEIVCRPSQFGRYLIYREALGYQNMFKELEAKLFTPEAPVIKREPVDVSSNSAQ